MKIRNSFFRAFISLVILTCNTMLFAEIDFFTNDSYALSAVCYNLVEGSSLIDDTDILARPTLMVPIRGSFYLKRLSSNPLFTNYAVLNLRFGSTTANNSYTGKFDNGIYRYGGEVAITQQMILKGYINDSPLLTLDSHMTVPTILHPWIEIDLVQVDPDNPFQYYRLHLVAVPWPKIWFSTSTSFTGSTGVKAGDGDLLSPSGLIIRRNNQLTERLGIMPSVPDLGLDAVMLGRFSVLPVPTRRYRPIWFSLLQDEGVKTAQKHFAAYWPQDLAWCRQRDKDYYAVVFPGFSWSNLKHGRDPLNAIPRLKGEFFWSQVEQVKQYGMNMAYVAMFDEVDEGTAVFKCTNNPPVDNFVTYEGLPSDHYLKLTGKAGQFLRDSRSREKSP